MFWSSVVGGPQWFVTVLVEKRLGQVYNKDVEGNRDGVQLTAYIDLMCSTLPRCLAGEGKKGLLSHPEGRSLARLTVQCLAASLVMMGSKPYCRVREGRGTELAQLCNWIQQPVKLRKLVVGDLWERV